MRDWAPGADTPLKDEACYFLAPFKTSAEGGHMISISVFLFLTRSGVILAVRNKLSVNDRTKMYFQFVWLTKQSPVFRHLPTEAKNDRESIQWKWLLLQSLALNWAWEGWRTGTDITLFRRRAHVEGRNTSTSFGLIPIIFSINSRLRKYKQSSLCPATISENIIYKTSKKERKEDGMRNSFFYRKISAGII